MKLMRYVLTAAALTVAMVSCRKNGVEESEDHPKSEIELTARISDGSSRHWTDDDRIHVYHRFPGGKVCVYA